ncbi:MAG: rhodanese-like domain-containing protein [Crocinitomicaceae bacterium]|tara:strand:- start:3083 stop:3319 length:237 start_codon:yes stop_codon:yes gene_type:complete
MKGTIIDVRTVAEFEAGNIEGSLNIPVQEIMQHVEEIKKIEGPIIFCCKSGQRSGMANDYFSSIGVDCSNGGSWLDLM